MSKHPEGAASFGAGGDAYDAFMGRYAVALAPLMADLASVGSGQRALDVGCGTGALTGELVRRLGPEQVAGCDPSPLLKTCRARYPEVDLRAGVAEELPFEDHAFDVSLAQLVLHFVTDPALALGQMQRVVAPGGRVAACVWDSEGGMEMLTACAEAVKDETGELPDRLRRWPFGQPGALSHLFTDAGLQGVTETQLTVTTHYDSFEELWSTLLLAIGPAGTHVSTMTAEQQQSLAAAYRRRMGSPQGDFSLRAVARAAIGTVPG